MKTSNHLICCCILILPCIIGCTAESKSSADNSSLQREIETGSPKNEQSQEPLPQTTEDYVVKGGESLSLIAKREYGDGELWYVLLNANPDLRFRPDFQLSPGERIKLPKRTEIDLSLPKSVFPESLPAQYIVLPGDSLHFIALNCYGDREKWKIIYDANREKLTEAVLEDTRRLIAGQELLIPEIE